MKTAIIQLKVLVNDGSLAELKEQGCTDKQLQTEIGKSLVITAKYGSPVFDIDEVSFVKFED